MPSAWRASSAQATWRRAPRSRRSSGSSRRGSASRPSPPSTRAAGRSVGSRGALAVCSFYATKLLTTGEGGAVAGAPERVARVRDARDYDEREDLVPRFNFKLTDIQAALGRSQLGRLDAFIARRR